MNDTFTLYDAFEFLIFVIPRMIQSLLAEFIKLHWLDDGLAMSLYIGLSYFGAALLVGIAGWQLRRSMQGQMLIISWHTSRFLSSAAVLLAIALFTAMAPTSGLSLRYCTKAAAAFVTFGS